MKAVGAPQQLQYDIFYALFFLLMLFSSARESLVKEVFIEVIYMNATVYNGPKNCLQHQLHAAAKIGAIWQYCFVSSSGITCVSFLSSIASKFETRFLVPAQHWFLVPAASKYHWFVVSTITELRLPLKTHLPFHKDNREQGFYSWRSKPSFQLISMKNIVNRDFIHGVNS